MIKSVVFSGLEPGPRFLVIGAVHGNEKCGTAACNRVIQEIESGQLKILRGRVTFVPIGNPRAYDLDQRFYERNLNRYLVPIEKPNSYEAQLGNILCPMLADCDAHLAIHSYTVGGDPFMIVAPNNPREQEFAASLGPWTLLTGWKEAYAKTGRGAAAGVFSGPPAEESTGSIEYARRNGAIALTIECGQHKDPVSDEVAYRAIRNALRYLGLTDEPRMEPAKPMHLVTVTHVIYRDDMETVFTRPWQQFETIARGDVIARNPGGETLTAANDGCIIMPKADTPLGEEWYYLGVDSRI